MFYLILSDELRKVQLSLVVCEEILALRDGLSLQSIAHCLIVLPMLLNHCERERERERERGGGGGGGK